MKMTDDQLIGFLKDNLQFDGALDDQSALFSTGALDSVAMLNLIAFVEETSGVRVRPEDVTLDNFDSVASIVRYAENQA